MESKNVSELAKQVRGVSYKPEDLHDGLNDKSVILLRANNINDGKINFDDVVYVDKSKVSKEQYLQNGDILICASSGSKQLVGKAASVDFDIECTFGAFCKVVRPNPSIAEFLGIYFQSNTYRQKVSEVAIGANINNIRNEHIDNLILSVGTDEENSEIVRMMKVIQRLIDERKQEVQELDKLVKARFIEVFGDPVTNSMRWYETTVGDECFYIKDGPHKSLTDIGKENGGHPFISVRNIVNGYIDLSTARYISDDDYAEAIKKCHPEKGDILYSKGGTTGIAKLVDIDEKFANWVHVAVLKFDKTKLNGVFLENMLNGAYCYEQSQRLTKGIANRDLVLSAIAKIKLYRPPIYLQEKFADFVRQADKSKAVIEKSLKELETLQASLMQKYFS